MSVRERLEALQIVLPKPPSPVAAYLPAVVAGELIFVSGQIPIVDGVLVATGAIPSRVSIEEGQRAARQCVLNVLAVLDAFAPGGLESVRRIVRVGVFVASDPGFTEQPKVANGASELLQEIFGEAGRHARAAVGSVALPLGAAVEVELIAQLRAQPV